MCRGAILQYLQAVSTVQGSACSNQPRRLNTATVITYPCWVPAVAGPFRLAQMQPGWAWAALAGEQGHQSLLGRGLLSRHRPCLLAALLAPTGDIKQSPSSFAIN